MITKKLACPSCGVGLRVADTLPAGKRIKCPKCGDAFAVPDAAPPQPRKAAPPVEDEENPFELVDDEAPAPRKRRKKSKKAAGNSALMMGLVLGGATLLLGGAAVLAVTFWPAKDSGAVAANTPAALGAKAGSDQVAAGRQVFEANNCARCHAVGGVGGSDGGGPRGRMRGPDLGSVGRDPAHTVDWLMEYVRNPLTHKPDARMPSFEGKISDSDLRALAEYLASLK